MQTVNSSYHTRLLNEHCYSWQSNFQLAAITARFFLEPPPPEKYLKPPKILISEPILLKNSAYGPSSWCYFCRVVGMQHVGVGK